MNKNDELRNLVRECWRDFDDLKNDPDTQKYIVDTMPILYFGNLDAYMKSDIKIITVGRNPSSNEFANNKKSMNYHFNRFPAAKNLWHKKADDLTDDDINNYLESLNKYFKEKPYTNWFDNIPRKNLLKELKSSYYENEENCSLHIDIWTSIATTPVWSGLKNKVKNKFIVKGNAIWFKLLDILNPDILIMSVKDDDMKGLEFYNTLETFETYTHKVNGEKYKRNPLTINSFKYNTNNKEILIYNESIQNVIPFNLVGNERCTELGKKIYSEYIKNK